MAQVLNDLYSESDERAMTRAEAYTQHQTACNQGPVLSVRYRRVQVSTAGQAYSQLPVHGIKCGAGESCREVVAEDVSADTDTVGTR